jgi:glycosyltransferase involved in cell wall biosynthesis
MKILIISDAWHPQVNGVVRTYENISRELLLMGHDVRVIGPADFPRNCACPGYNEIRLTFNPARQLKTTIELFHPDHIHIAVEGPLGWAARKICLKKNIPFTTCYHTHFPDYLALRIPTLLSWVKKPLYSVLWRIFRQFHNAAHCTFVASHTLQRLLQDNGFTGRFQIMTRGIDHDLFYPGAKNLFHDLPRPIALFVGRVAIEKNIEAFLNANWNGSKVIVGHGPALSMLKAKFPNAHFLGTKSGVELGDCYRSADLFVFPSKTDTFGMVNIEAMACGLPIAAYPVLGPIDIVTSPELGALDHNLEIAMTNAISGDGRAEFRANHAKKTYSWTQAATQFLSATSNYG